MNLQTCFSPTKKQRERKMLTFRFLQESLELYLNPYYASSAAIHCFWYYFIKKKNSEMNNLCNHVILNTYDFFFFSGSKNVRQNIRALKEGKWRVIYSSFCKPDVSWSVIWQTSTKQSHTGLEWKEGE